MHILAVIIFLSLFGDIQNRSMQKRKAAASFGSMLNIGRFVTSTAFDIVSLVADDKQHDEMSERMDALENMIKNQGQNVTSVLSTLIFEIKKSSYSNIINDAEREISNCYNNLKILVKSPNSQQSIENIKACYSQMSHVRQIAKILSGQTVGINRENFFDMIIRHQGYCNGTELVGFQRSFNLNLMQGCAAVVSAEVLQYGNSSSQYRDDCMVFFRETDIYAKNLFNKCAQEPCTLILKNMNTALQEASSVNDAFEILSSVFPWFHFLVIEMVPCNHECFKENIKIIGNDSFNLHTFPTKDRMFLVSYLDQQYSSNEYGDHFGFELRQSCKIAMRHDLGVKMFDLKGGSITTIYMYKNDSVTAYADICDNGSTTCTANLPSTGCSIMMVNYKGAIFTSFTIMIVTLMK